MNYEEYKPAIRLGGGLIPSGSGTFPVARACDILMPDGSRLDIYLANNSGSVDAQDTTWLIKDTPDVTMLDRGFDVLFTSNGGSYKKMIGANYSGTLMLFYMASTEGGTSQTVYRSDTGWTDEAYKEITIQESVTDQELLNWLAANAILKESNGGLPPYTEADNGKFLRLVDGSPAWVLIEDGNGVRY